MRGGGANRWSLLVALRPVVNLALNKKAPSAGPKESRLAPMSLFFMSVEKLKKRHKRVWRGGAQVRVEF